MEEKIAKEGIILTEAQISALEKKQQDDAAAGKIETANPRNLGSQDTFYVGTLKGIGRNYQQTFVDNYSKVAFAKLYRAKIPITAVGLLNDRVFPCFQRHEFTMLRILTDRGTKYCGRAKNTIISSTWLRSHKEKGSVTTDRLGLRAIQHLKTEAK